MPNSLRVLADYDRKVTYAGLFADGMKDTEAKTRDLIRNDSAIRTLAEALKQEATPERISVFVAAVESKIEKFRYDMPGWEGNDFFNHGRGNEYVKGKDYLQLGCIGEAAHAGAMVTALAAEGFLPPDTTWDYIGNGSHWAPVIYQEKKSLKESPGFILDTWLAAPGQPAPVFNDDRTWNDAVKAIGDADYARQGMRRKAFYAQLAALQTSGEIPDTAGAYWTKRKFDQKFLAQWQKENLPGQRAPHTVMYAGGYNDEGANEAEQDRVAATYFLGDKPLLPASEVNDNFFRSIRERVAMIVEKDAANPALKGLSAGNMRAAKDFAELKPQLEAFYTAYDAMPSRPGLREEEVMALARRSDANGDGKLGFSESRVLAELLRPAIKDAPQAGAVFEKMPWQDMGTQDAAKAVVSGLAARKPDTTPRR